MAGNLVAQGVGRPQQEQQSIPLTKKRVRPPAAADRDSASVREGDTLQIKFLPHLSDGGGASVRAKEGKKKREATWNKEVDGERESLAKLTAAATRK